MHSAISNWDSRSWSASTIRGMRPGKRAFLDQRLGSSFHFSFFGGAAPAGAQPEPFALLGVGMQYTLDKLPALRQYRHALGNDGGRVVRSRWTNPPASRKAVTSSLGIPVRLTLHSGETPEGSRPSPIPTSLLGADAIYK